MIVRTSAVAAVTVLLGLSLAAAKEEKITLDKVPTKVAQAEKAKWPKAEIVLIEQEEDNGKTIYEFGLKEGTRKWDASFGADGALVAVEETIAEKDVPAAVKKALEQKHPKATVTLVEKVTEGDGPSAKIFYEYKIKTQDKAWEVKFDPAGKLVSEEEKKAGDTD
jgi:uncharacterized membrane protein YkoI